MSSWPAPAGRANYSASLATFLGQPLCARPLGGVGTHAETKRGVREQPPPPLFRGETPGRNGGSIDPPPPFYSVPTRKISKPSSHLFFGAEFGGGIKKKTSTWALGPNYACLGPYMFWVTQQWPKMVPKGVMNTPKPS